MSIYRHVIFAALFLIFGCIFSCIHKEEVATIKIYAPNLFRQEVYELINYVEKNSKIRIFLQFYSHSNRQPEVLSHLDKNVRAPFDLIIYPLHHIHELNKRDLIRPLRPYKLVYYPNLKPAIRSTEFDPSGIYSLPFAVRDFGLWINSYHVGEKEPFINLRSLQSFFKNSKSPNFQFAYQSRQLVWFFLQTFNQKDPCRVTYRNRLIFRRNLKRFKHIASTQNLLEEVAVYLGEKKRVSEQLQRRKPDSKLSHWQFTFPNEGGAREIYSFFLFKSSLHPNVARRVLNFYLKPKLQYLREANEVQAQTTFLPAADQGDRYNANARIRLLPSCLQPIL